ncbi:MAG: hypothetical protein J6M30_00770 [Bacteroidales bacterium]|nr:hypothetical protein [Bacteroidales bacterium]
MDIRVVCQSLEQYKDISECKILFDWLFYNCSYNIKESNINDAINAIIKKVNQNVDDNIFLTLDAKYKQKNINKNFFNSLARSIKYDFSKSINFGQ